MLNENFKSKKVVQKSSFLRTGLYLITHGAPQGRNLSRPGLPLGNLTENINEHFFNGGQSLSRYCWPLASI